MPSLRKRLLAELTPEEQAQIPKLESEEEAENMPLEARVSLQPEENPKKISFLRNLVLSIFIIIATGACLFVVFVAVLWKYMDTWYPLGPSMSAKWIFYLGGLSLLFLFITAVAMKPAKEKDPDEEPFILVRGINWFNNENPFKLWGYAFGIVAIVVVVLVVKWHMEQWWFQTFPNASVKIMWWALLSVLILSVTFILKVLTKKRRY